MSEKIPASVAMVKVLESWGVDHLYGIPGGSFNSTMDGLYERQQHIRYIQVRHEETGAIAAAADAKLTGKIGVCFGSAGPGATHLFNGLYDAQMDHVPVLALIGQVASSAMNYHSFQELNENPMFADVSVYNRTVMTPESLPHVVNEAIKQAYEHRGVAVVTIPVDFGVVEIPDLEISTAHNYKENVFLPNNQDDLEVALKLIAEAKQPILYVGQGLRGGFEEIKAFSKHFAMPVASTVLAKGIIPDDYENYLGTAARVAGKPANEALPMADLIIFAGSDFPFAKFVFNPNAKMIQIDIDSTKFGRRHQADVTILADGKATLRALTEKGTAKPETKWLTANQKNIQNWHQWMASFENNQDIPMRVEPVFKEINRIAEKDAIFITDVGNSTIYAVRHLKMNGQQRFTTSGWFATMGYGVPGGIAGKLSYPNRQVFTLNGDGAFAMVMQDVITQVKYQLPVINIVFSNNSLGFIEAEQEDTKQSKYGVLLEGADFAKIGEGMGAKGFTVTDPKDLERVFNEAKASDVPVVIDIKLANLRPIPVENLILDEDIHGKEAVEAFKKRYDVHDLPLLKELL